MVVNYCDCNSSRFQLPLGLKIKVGACLDTEVSRGTLDDYALRITQFRVNKILSEQIVILENLPLDGLLVET